MGQGLATDILTQRRGTLEAPSREFSSMGGLPVSECAVQRFTPQIRSALLLLHDAAACAEDVDAELWQFSVEISALQQLGLTTNECRWLVAKGLAKHACETTTTEADRRVFQSCSNLSLPAGTCFVIGERGLAYANMLLRSQPHPGQTENHLSESALSVARSISIGRPSVDRGESLLPNPTWDPDRQQLRVGRIVVKEFKVPAANQEAILAAFQEEGWAPRIDDPLTPKPNQDSKRRLHDTINSLNRNQKRPVVRFLGDGKGEGVRWEFVRPHDSVNEDDDRTAWK